MKKLQKPDFGLSEDYLSAFEDEREHVFWLLWLLFVNSARKAENHTELNSHIWQQIWPKLTK